MELLGHIATLMVFGSVLFWVLTVAWVIAMFWCVEKEDGFMSGLWLILYLLFLNFLAKVDIISGIQDTPIRWLIIWSLYFLIGFGWSFIKWWLLVDRLALKVKEKRRDFLVETIAGRLKRGVTEIPGLPMNPDEVTIDTPIPEHLMASWKSKYIQPPPQVSSHKNLISLWIIHWPFSMIWSILNDFVKKLINALVIKFRAVYNAITARAYQGLDI